MLTIRLSRTGAKKRPFFHITVADSRMPRDGRFIERVGYFNPIAKGKEIRLEVNKERVDYWLTQGAKVSDRVFSLFKSTFCPLTPQKMVLGSQIFACVHILDQFYQKWKSHKNVRWYPRNSAP